MSRREQNQPFGVSLAFVFFVLLAGAAEDWAFGPALDFPAHIGEGVADALGDGFGERRVEDGAFCEFFFGGFVVGFDEGDDLAVVFEPGAGGGEGAVLFGPAEVHDNQIYTALLGDFGWGGCMQCVGAFVDGCSIVLSEFPRELAVGGVDAVDMGRAVVEEAVGEAASGASEVGADEVGGVEIELGQGVVEFEAASGDIGICIGLRWLRWEIHLSDFGGRGGGQGTVGDRDADDRDFEFVGSFDHRNPVKHDDIARGDRETRTAVFGEVLDGLEPDGGDIGSTIVLGAGTFGECPAAFFA